MQQYDIYHLKINRIFHKNVLFYQCYPLKERLASHFDIYSK